MLSLHTAQFLFPPDGIAHLVDGRSLNSHSAATTIPTKRIPKGGACISKFSPQKFCFYFLFSYLLWSFYVYIFHFIFQIFTGAFRINFIFFKFLFSGNLGFLDIFFYFLFGFDFSIFCLYEYSIFSAITVPVFSCIMLLYFKNVLFFFMFSVYIFSEKGFCFMTYA